MDLSKLKEPFRAGDIEWRLQQSGETNGRIWAKCLAYVTARAIEARLDEACGSENWKNEFREAPRGGILCGISIKCGNEWVTKWDGADNTQVESVKGGLSDAMKRAGVQWGIGRYLYDLDEGWAVISEKGTYTGKTKEGKWFRWNPPELPAWALPKGESTFQGNGASKNAVPPAPVPETNPPAKGGAGTPPPQNPAIKEKGNAVISRIGGIMKHEEKGRRCFTENEINQIRGVVANTQLTETGIKELEELEKVVREELTSRLSKMAA